MATPLKPGMKAPLSGQYQQIGPQGGKGKEVTVVKGEPLPPAPKPGTTYKVTDPTKNKVRPAIAGAAPPVSRPCASRAGSFSTAGKYASQLGL